MGRFDDNLRKSMGLPPATAEETERLKQETQRIKDTGGQMMMAGCGLTLITILAVLLLILVA